MTDQDHEHHDEHIPVAYKDAVEGFRLDKDEFFQTDPRGPIPEAERVGFSGLPYYPVDEALVFEDWVLESYTGDEPSNSQIPTSDGEASAGASGGHLALRAR